MRCSYLEDPSRAYPRIPVLILLRHWWKAAVMVDVIVDVIVEAELT